MGQSPHLQTWHQGRIAWERPVPLEGMCVSTQVQRSGSAGSGSSIWLLPV